MRPGYGTKFLRPDDVGEAHEIADRVFVGGPGAVVGDMGESPDFRRDVSEPVRLGGGQESLGRGDWGRKLGVGHGHYVRRRIK
jgi:hypothetical protein